MSPSPWPLALGILTFLTYYRFAAGTLLHEPVAAGNPHDNALGSALGFMDRFALVTPLYVVGFRSYGLPMACRWPAGAG